MSDGYNGWTNYETWNLNLWLTSDQGSSEYWAERAQEHYDEAEECNVFTRLERAIINLADELRESIEEDAPGVEGFYADILNAALREVDYCDIAESFMSEIDVSDVTE